MVDPKFDKQENFVIDEKYNEEELKELNREDYYDDHSGILQKKYFTPFTVGGIGLVIIVILFIVLLTGTKDTVDSEQLQSLETRIQQLEKKLASVAGMDQTLDQIGKQEEKLNSIGQRFDSFNSAVSTQIDQIIKELGALHKKSSQSPAPQAQQTQQAAITGKKEAKPEFHQVRPKETLWGISRQYGLSLDQLRSYNNIGPKGTIRPGQQLKLTPK
jgi:LysM repeat protein